MADYLQGELKQMDHLFYYTLRQVAIIKPPPVVAVQTVAPETTPASPVLPQTATVTNPKQ
jgi:hypothetical protein